jgi:hypothetical protein
VFLACGGRRTTTEGVVDFSLSAATREPYAATGLECLHAILIFLILYENSIFDCMYVLLCVFGLGGCRTAAEFAVNFFVCVATRGPNEATGREFLHLIVDFLKIYENLKIAIMYVHLHVFVLGGRRTAAEISVHFFCKFGHPRAKCGCSFYFST